MSTRTAIKRYHIIINRLRRKPSTLQEIMQAFEIESEHGYDFYITKKTFKRDLNDIKAIYDIVIKYDFSQKVYYIKMEGQLQSTQRLFEAFETFSALNISDRISEYMLFEDKQPQGTEHLSGFLKAIKDKKQVRITHKKYWEEPQIRNIEPYALKESLNRWYLLAKDLKDNRIKTFGLDRITDFEVFKNKIDEDSIPDIKNYFKNAYGVITSKDNKPDEIILRFDVWQAYFIKSSPLHHSQEITQENDDFVEIRLKLCITDDFVMELVKYGGMVQVLKPKRLINQVIESHKKAIDLYNPKK